MLKIADPNKEFEVYIDACQEGVGIVFSRDGKIIVYKSRKLKEHEHQYSAHNLDLTVVVHALKIWRHYLLGKIFILKTNHISLTIYFKQFDQNGHQARWNAFLSEFEFKIQHVKGEENQVADALSRQIHCIYELCFNWVEFIFQEKIKETAQTDPEYQFIWLQVQQVDNQEIKSYYMMNDEHLLTFLGKIYIMNQVALREIILDEYY